MKIAILVPSLRKTAPVNIAISIYNYIKNNYDVTLFYLDELKILDNKINNIPEAILLTKKNYKILKNFNIVHSHGLRPDLITFLYAKKNSRVTTLHSMIIKDLRSRYGIKGFCISYLWLFILIFFNKKVSISNSVKEHLLKKKIKTQVIYNGIEFNTQARDIETDKKYLEIKHYVDSVRKGRIIVGTISHIERIKGIEQLIELAKKNKNIFLVIIGDGTYKSKIEQLVSLYNLDDRVFFAGYIDNNAKYYSKLFDVYVQPSINEGFGLSVIEAICNEIPVVCSNIEVFTELFNKKQISFFQLNDINSLNNAVQIAKNKDIIDLKYIANNIKNRFSITNMSENYITLYKSIIKNER